MFRFLIKQRRVKLLLIIAAACLTLSIDVNAFGTTSWNQISRTWNNGISSTKHSSTTKSRESNSPIDKHQIEYVDFWGTKLRRDGEEPILVLPVDRNLDRLDGPLPAGAYLLRGNPNFDPRPTCRIALSIDWLQRHSRFALAPLDGDQVVRQIQHCFDAGFQTFQLSRENGRSPETSMIGRIIQETPKSVELHWTVQLNLPKQISPVVVRETVFNLLSQTKMDSLDTLLVPYDSEILPQYHLEVLDVLQDMQRDGYIRSIGVENWPYFLVKEAKMSGFSIDVHQRNGNLLLPPPRMIEKGEIPADLWTNPLAGNVLSDNFLLSPSPPTYSRGWNDVRTWYNRKRRSKQSKMDIASASNADVWSVFKKDVQETLHRLSCKHEVSIATIVLRWSLQEKTSGKKNIIASCVAYPLALIEEPEGNLSKQIRGLRDVFRFQLDEDDLEALHAITAQPKPKTSTIRIDEMDVPRKDIPIAFLRDFEALHGEEEDETEDEEYPEINFNNPALWL